ncbi:MAG: SUMF1/EgtB/PvdO family nonheme iron enzyme [Victivallales bacterium]|jgi:formylglycine-generating enzyme required for sulfatase activity|nr:SUMF1/EgtB/PvdO family nonheme iron enzyme [Victivallales bacterium]
MGMVFRCRDENSQVEYAVKMIPPELARDDPTGPTTDSFRVNRGGSWNFSARFCRSACRLNVSPGSRYDSLGFRVALASLQ